MKNYYIHRIELVSSKEHGTVLQIVADRNERDCPKEVKLRCEKLRFLFCPTFVMKYDKELYLSLSNKKDSRETMYVSEQDYVVERLKVYDNQPSKVFYVQKNLIQKGTWDRLKKNLAEKIHHNPTQQPKK